MRIKRYFGFVYQTNHHAGSKAKEDANRIFEKNGYKKINLVPPKIKNLRVVELCYIFFALFKLPFIKNSDFILNFPAEHFGEAFIYEKLFKQKEKKNLNVIFLIHDIEELRGGERALGKKGCVPYFHSLKALFLADAVIAHTSKMKTWLVEKGFDSQKISVLEIFDYLFSTPRLGGHFGNEVIVAGNLSPEKVGFLETLPENQAINYKLYGPNFNAEKSAGTQLHYMGSFSPDEIPEKISGSFGLIWDSETAEGGHGENGHYQRYNSPHKASLYLVAGFPIIIWREAALDDFVEREGIGFSINHLGELDEKIQALTKEDYEMMQRNVWRVASKLSQGAYLSAALELL
ncbi:MAG: beta-1,6-galactofuranosyltransferase [Streptococcaceae bacterium]|jgi:hypothetical protein|nr:beta-1,6-galactofuranosyltransferase [Streptococcaceae bacterium]